MRYLLVLLIPLTLFSQELPRRVNKTLEDHDQQLGKVYQTFLTELKEVNEEAIEDLEREFKRLRLSNEEAKQIEVISQMGLEQQKVAYTMMSNDQKVGYKIKQKIDEINYSQKKTTEMFERDFLGSLSLPIKDSKRLEKLLIGKTFDLHWTIGEPTSQQITFLKNHKTKDYNRPFAWQIKNQKLILTSGEIDFAGEITNKNFKTKTIDMVVTKSVGNRHNGRKIRLVLLE